MSSLTNFLKLFKWDTKTDGSEKFNIDKALNGNWDKTDEAIENLQKTTVSTSVSEEITVTDCAGVNAKLDIKNGKTIQDGTPTPEAPIEIRNVGDNVNLCGGTPILESTTRVKYVLTNIKSNKTHTLSNFNLPSNIYIAIRNIYNESSTTNKILWKKSGTFTTESNTTALEIVFAKGDAQNETISVEEVKKYNVKLEQNPVATSYSKYNCANIDFTLKNKDNSQSKTVSFPLAEGQVLHDGDYLADDGIHQMRKILILNGTENWVFSGNNWVYFDVNDIIAESGLTNSFCNIAKEKTSSDAYSSSEFCFATTNTKKIAFKCMGYNSLEAWKSYLVEEYANGTPVTIEYELTEEIVIPYTTEQEKAYYQLQHLLMYEGYTNISCVNEIKPDIQLTYYYNNLLNKSYAKRFDELEEKIRNLQIGG